MMIIDGKKNYKKIRVQKLFMNDHVIQNLIITQLLGK